MVLEGARRPLSHEVHRCLAVGHRAGLAVRRVPSGGEEAVLERLERDQLGDLLAAPITAGTLKLLSAAIWFMASAPPNLTIR